MFVNKLICIKGFENFDSGHHLSKNLYYIKINRYYYNHVYKIYNIDGIDCYIIYGRNDQVNNDNFAYYIPIKSFDDHLSTLAELRENRINKILN
jgi:hypothetical protein